MEHWELVARESIRDLVARYNANGDSGRTAEVLALFTADAALVVEETSYDGHDGIRSLFESTAALVRDWPGGAHVRHLTATLQIDLVNPTNAWSRCYFQVVMAHGLDHWGRYLDEYEVHDGRWLFSRRRVLVDGRTPDGWAERNPTPTHEAP